MVSSLMVLVEQKQKQLVLHSQSDSPCSRNVPFALQVSMLLFSFSPSARNGIYFLIQFIPLG